VTALTELLHHLVTNLPQEKVVVFSQYLKYLDILNIAMKRKYDIQCLRFDGKVPQKNRRAVQRQFADQTKARPLLITAGAGSVGLNLT
jgi:SNF2 family DNA or RNA helicase